ncbi:SEC14 cytosolic factor-like [Pyrus ussuriensis x Pyrus communis]|uniref:SEC14 cytosolic factor-like n=1 Tax=Pyrus ussuriensis x Pyrus communis TaxID=2448454 RepID=A0A5N5G0Y8_9ROSA|nr:SEC14 cytosolic factor-like [Pyrus ussuriensis x Pyrus communis]
MLEGMQVVSDMECKETMKDEAEEAVTLVRIRRVREFVEGKDPSSKEVDDPTIRRVLRACNLDIEQASAMIPNQIAQNNIFLQGSDKNGCPIAVILGYRHFQNSLKEFKLTFPHFFRNLHTITFPMAQKKYDESSKSKIYGLDKICAKIPLGQEKFIAIGDLEGWGYSNSDLQGYLGALSILQDYYPERLGKMYIVHAPLIFMRVWKIVYPFIDNKTKKKIVFVENKMLKSTLLEEIDASQLPKIYGGKLPLVPV